MIYRNTWYSIPRQHMGIGKHRRLRTVIVALIAGFFGIFAMFRHFHFALGCAIVLWVIIIFGARMAYLWLH
jgi:hypothetical protein